MGVVDMHSAPQLALATINSSEWVDFFKDNGSSMPAKKKGPSSVQRATHRRSSVPRKRKPATHRARHCGSC
jgi:hypothetical protein